MLFEYEIDVDSADDDLRAMSVILLPLVHMTRNTTEQMQSQHTRVWGSLRTSMMAV